MRLLPEDMMRVHAICFRAKSQGHIFKIIKKFNRESFKQISPEAFKLMRFKNCYNVAESVAIIKQPTDVKI